jgi:OOP family OmpA-OmpF porin
MLSRALASSSIVIMCACGSAPPPTEPAVPDDGDDVVGAHDACPTEPEDEDGFEDLDGCPEADNDRDGIADVDDLCPCDAEDVDQWVDTDGCPDLDNDGDRILDVCDSCPDEAETYNGRCDNDGCPDRGHVLISESRIVILEYIRFRRGSAMFEQSSTPIVDAIAATLAGNPQITLIAIVGEAEPREPRRQGLALRRAETILEALVERGVPRERLVAEADPAPVHAPTDPPEARRRVRFDIRTIDGESINTTQPMAPTGPEPRYRDACEVPVCTPAATTPSVC